MWPALGRLPGVDRQHILGRAAAGPGGGVRVAHFLDQVVGVQPGTATRGDPLHPLGHLLPTGSQNHFDGF